MILHKILRGERAGVYLPFALSRLRALERINKGGFFTQKFELDGYSIEVQQAPPFQYVRIVESGAIQFEFFASEKVDGYYYSTPGYRPFEIGGIGQIQGSGVRASFSGNRVTGRPVYSTILEPEVGGRQWPMRDAGNVGIPLATKSEDFFKMWASWQAQKVGEACWYPNNKPDQVVMSTWGTPLGRSSMVGWGDYHWSDIVGGLQPPYDVYYDMAPTLYDADGGVYGVLGPYLGDNCWWRHGAMQTIDSPFGQRRLFIVGDNKGRLHVYPVKKYYDDEAYWSTLATVGGLLSSASTAIDFKTVTPSYPAWVTMPDVNELDVLLWWNWNFNKDATKAATIALHEEPRAGYYFYTDTYNPLNVTTWRAFLGIQYRDDPPAIFHTSKRGLPPRVLTPGLIEIAINIEITGPGDMDFNVTTQTLQSDYFGDSGRYYQDCGYLYKDPRINDLNGIENSLPEDTLVTAELQCYSTDGTWWCYDDINPDTEEKDREENDLGLTIFHAGTTGPFGPYQEGVDIVGADVHCAYVIRRQDTGAEIRRQLLSYAETIGDWFFPIGSPLSPLGPTGYTEGVLVSPISGIWLHNVYINSEFHFFNNGPGAGPFHGNYRYGVIAAADLRSLSYVVARNVISYDGVELVPGNWWPRVRHEHFQEDLYAFNEHVEARAFTADSIYTSDDFLGNPPISQGFVEGTPEDEGDQELPAEQRVPFDVAATPIYGACAINFLGLQTYNELKVHPKGHISFMMLDGAGEVGFDVLSVRKNGKDIRKTHQEVFNKAFEQDRDAGFYDGVGEIGFEAGSFRLTGLWLPYKE